MSLKLQASETTRYTTSSQDQLEYRDKLWELFKNAPLNEPELERSLGLFIRGSLLARLLAIDEVYRRIVNIPGVIFDVGCWRGQGSVMCENLRAIYEPFNKQRRVIAFDTFEGYRGVSSKDKPSESFKEGTYSVGKDYPSFLRQLLEVHEGNNALPHVRSVHRVIEGDATVTIPKYLKEHPETLLALVFMDLGLYEPTQKVLKALLSSKGVLPGTVFAFYHLTHDDILPGDSIAFQEVFADRKFTIERSRYYPTLSIVTCLE